MLRLKGRDEELAPLESLVNLKHTSLTKPARGEHVAVLATAPREQA